jgi:hypothetical protein
MPASSRKVENAWPSHRLCLQVVYHNLDAMFQHMFLTQNQNTAGAANMAGGVFGIAGGVTGGSMGGVLQPHGSNAVQGAVPGGAPSTNDVKNMVLKFLRENADTTGHGGIHLDAVVSAFAGQFRGDQVSMALKDLLNDAKVYTTTSEMVFCAIPEVE